MARKPHTIYVCQQCGAQSPRWLGKCPDCGEWNTLVETVAEPAPSAAKSGAAPRSEPQRLSDIAADGFTRIRVPIGEFDRVLGGGLVPGSLVLIGGDPGIGKCVTGDTRVLDPSTGDYLPITAWMNQARPVLGVDAERLQLVPAQVSGFHPQGCRPIVQVTTKLGRVLRCTPSHPLLTPEGWQPVADLRSGARIAAPRSLPFFGREAMADVEVKLIAYILSDGSAQSAITVTNALPAVAKDLVEIAAAFNVQLLRYPKPGQAATQYRFTIPLGERQVARDKVAAALRRVKTRTGLAWAEWARQANVSYSLLNVWRRGECVPSEDELHSLATAAGVPVEDLAPTAREQAMMRTPIASFLERHRLRFVRAADKRVPQCIFRLPRQQLALFLNRLFTCDGSVFINRRGLAGLSYATTSRGLAEDVQHLLLRFGIFTKLRTKHGKVREAEYISYELSAVGAKRVQQFVAAIGILGRESALRDLEALSPQFDSTAVDTVPTGERFWTALESVSGGAGYREISRRAGVVLRNRRRERPLRRSTVAKLADAFPYPMLDALGHGDVYWDEIESIVPVGEEEVYDLTVPGLDSFIANDLVIHNSTLLLQAVAALAHESALNGRPILYVSGEESAQQIKLRAHRLGLDAPNLFVLAETNLNHVIAQAEKMSPGLLVVDSIQAVYLDELTSAAGSISQVREGALRLMYFAKGSQTPVFLVGHVTKEGTIAGPRVLEHIVDAVLYLEGERFQAYRLLRSVKNRFGSTDEVGVFEMQEAGLVEVANPSAAFLAERLPGVGGNSVAVTMEGTRPLLVEMQALTSLTSFNYPRRTANGVDMGRLLLIIAVLSKRVGLRLFNQDVFVNVVGGLKVSEPAADLAVALAIASSFRDQAVASDLAVVGEVGLSGELRSVGQLEKRVSEAARLGFKRCLAPRLARRPRSVEGIEILGARTINEALEVALEK